jgi:hypothetical protein
MIEILQNQIDRSQVNTKDQAFIEFILAIQQDNVDRASIVQNSNMTKFPSVPSLGGVLSTRKGCYEAIFTDTMPEIGKWRRLNDSVTYSVGDIIPTTL